MSILAKNLKIIRKELRCTQSAMADILKVGFRTYVRYEAGERDAPVSVLVKIARLGNISLERLLTSEVDPRNISPVQAVSKKASVPEVKSVNFQSGQVNFKNPSRQELLTTDESERKLISVYRKMNPDLQKMCLESLNRTLKEGKSGPRPVSKTESRKSPKTGRRKKASSGKVAARRVTARPPKAKKKGRPGRKKVDQKKLREKIDRLKMITRSVQKVTVR